MKNFTIVFMMLFASISFAQDFPMDFESGTFSFVDFDGGAATVIDNPQSSGINTSGKVVQMIKSDGQTWGGSKLTLSSTIDFTTNQIFTMKVFSPRVGVPVLFKLENTDGSSSTELTASTTVVNEWEELTFDFTGATSGVYNNLVFIFENGTMGDGSANWTFLFDDIVFSPAESSSQMFPIDFETGTYSFVDFDGGAATVIDNPQSSGINTSGKVVQMIKSDGQTWGGSKLALSGTIDFTTNQIFTMKVFSPRVGVPVLFKLENGDGSSSTELNASTTVANEWETLTFDFTGATSGIYNNIVFIFENGTMGDGSADWTFLFDDIEFSASEVPPLTLPINFEGGPYSFIDFDGGVSTVISNPQSSGINTSATVAQMIRDGGQTWGGSKMVLNANIDFSSNNAFTMKVYSARKDVPVLLKLESADGTVTTELSVNTTVANEWETLTWDFSEAETDTYNSLVFMFDFGTVGDGSENSTFLFDDVELISTIKSDDATLNDLLVGGVTVTDFSSSKLDYSVELASGTTEVPAVTATSTDAKAEITITPASALPGTTTILVTAEDGTTTKTYSIAFTVATSTSIFNPEKSNVNIYTNKHTIFVALKDKLVDGHIDVYELTGKKIYAGKIINNQKQVSIKTKGIYIVHVFDKTNMTKFTKKILVQ